MAYCNEADLIDYLREFLGQDPVKAVTCAYSSDAGLGVGFTVFSLVLVGGLGMALTIRVQHPAPLLVVAIVAGGFFAASLPGIGAKILAILVFFGIAGAGLYIYQQAQAGL